MGKKDYLYKPPGNHKAEMQNRHKSIKKFKNIKNYGESQK